MLVSDLPAPLGAVVPSWYPTFDHTPVLAWMGFTPKGLLSQFIGKVTPLISPGYVCEYITKNIGTPNEGFERQNWYYEEKGLHEINRERLVAIHRLRPEPEDLRSIAGETYYQEIRQRWFKKDDLNRWSVNFQIVESYEIEGRPRIADILSAEAKQRLINHPAIYPRPLTDADRRAFADLRLVPRDLATSRGNKHRRPVSREIKIDVVVESEIEEQVAAHIHEDLKQSADEGMLTEQSLAVRKRDAELANAFARQREREGGLFCDRCGFRAKDAACLAGFAIEPRSLFDVHHLNPIAAGHRRTTMADFALLCPTCHRIEHIQLKMRTAALSLE